jgi:tetratricopeptide (TPR) repeat protein
MNEPERDGTKLARVIILIQKGRHEGARAELEAFHPAPPLDAAAWLLQAMLYRNTDTEKCWAVLSMALDRYPNHPMVNLRTGVFAYERGDLERARILLEHSWATGPNPEAGIYLGRIYAARGEVERGCQFLAQAASFDGERAYWWERAGRELSELLSEARST